MFRCRTRMGFQLTINNLADDIFGQINNVLISSVFDGQVRHDFLYCAIAKSNGILKVLHFN